MTNFLLTALAVSLILNLSLFLVAFRFQTDRLTDASYGITFIILAIYGFVTCHSTNFHLLILWMVIIWAVRLSGFLLYRIWQKEGCTIRRNASQLLDVWSFLATARFSRMGDTYTRATWTASTCFC